MLRKSIVIITALFLSTLAISQVKTAPGILAGNIVDEKVKALEGATVNLISLSDTLSRRSTATDKSGSFTFNEIPFGYYRLQVSFIGMQAMTIDSIHFRTERYDFNLSDITLKPRSTDNLETVVIYA